MAWIGSAMASALCDRVWGCKEMAAALEREMGRVSPVYSILAFIDSPSLYILKVI
jgi:hypothetical protein